MSFEVIVVGGGFTGMTAAAALSKTGARLYENKGYREPIFERFGQTEPAPEIPGIEWTCTYANPTDKTFKFGPFTDDNEHCNLFMFYYPSETTHEFMTCVQKDTVTQVVVHGN